MRSTAPQAGGQVLTAWTGNAGLSGDALATGSCIFCHGESATFTDVNINTESASSLSPHGRCQRCHTPSPHGAGASKFPLLKSKLIINGIDAAIDADLAAAPGDANYNGLTADMFDLSDPALVGTGISLGTGYLCTECHDNASNPVVFAVNTFGATPTIAGLGYHVACHRSPRDRHGDRHVERERRVRRVLLGPAALLATRPSRSTTPTPARRATTPSPPPSVARRSRTTTLTPLAPACPRRPSAPRSCG